MYYLSLVVDYALVALSTLCSPYARRRRQRLWM